MASIECLQLPNGVKMPTLGYGTWQSNDDSLENALEVALESGYRHIDTAEAYQNEEIIGTVLKRWFDSGKLKREEVFITTKLSPTSMYPDKVEDCLKESLKKLQLDYVDLYLIHFPITIVSAGPDTHGHPDIDYLDIWKKMEEQHDAGKAKAIGVSNFSIKKIQRLVDNCRIKPANNQIEMHLYLQQKELVDYCKNKEIRIVAYAPLGSRGYNSFLGQLGLPSRELRDVFEDDVVQEIAKKHSKTVAQIALRYLLQSGVAPIPKSVTPGRVKENFDVFDFSLDQKEMDNLRRLDVGSEARVCDFKVMEKIVEHPLYEF